MKFKQFIKQYENKVYMQTHVDDISEEEKDIKRTLSKIPKGHAKLVQGYKWKFEPGNTLNGDDEHIGYIDDSEKEIAVAAPWNYGREFTILHEIGHRVWDRLSPYLKREWEQIVKNTKRKQNQSPEELFCMAYANHYAKNKIVIHDHNTWHKFIERLPEDL